MPRTLPFRVAVVGWSYPAAMSVTDWLLEGDPAIRWQVLRDLTDAPPDEVAAERARVEHEGWGARLLALEGADGLWAGGACFPAAYTGEGPGQPWTATMHTLQTLQLLGLDPASASARRAVALVAEHGRWEHAGQRYFDGEVVDPAYLEFAFPYYWHYDVLRGLDYFRRSGAGPDPRMAEAVEVVRSKRQPDGRWLLDRIHPGRVHFDLEGGVGAPSRWNTLRALRVLDWWDQRG
jgi:hypothetical protein